MFAELFDWRNSILKVLFFFLAIVILSKYLEEKEKRLVDIIRSCQRRVLTRPYFGKKLLRKGLDEYCGDKSDVCCVLFTLLEKMLCRKYDSKIYTNTEHH